LLGWSLITIEDLEDDTKGNQDQAGLIFQGRSVCEEMKIESGEKGRGREGRIKGRRIVIAYLKGRNRREMR
jgi:hypothetical protein